MNETLYNTIYMLYGSGTEQDSLRIDLVPIRKKYKPIYDYQRANIFAYDVTDLLNKKIPINSLEGYFRPINSKNTPSEIFCYGMTKSPEAGIKELNLKWIDTSFNGYNVPYSNGIQHTTNSYLATPSSVQGMSGAPVFFEFGHNPDSIFIEGVISTGVDSPANLAIIVKPEEIEKEIDRVLKLK